MSELGKQPDIVLSELPEADQQIEDMEALAHSLAATGPEEVISFYAYETEGGTVVSFSETVLIFGDDKVTTHSICIAAGEYAENLAVLDLDFVENSIPQLPRDIVEDIYQPMLAAIEDLLQHAELDKDDELILRLIGNTVSGVVEVPPPYDSQGLRLEDVGQMIKLRIQAEAPPAVSSREFIGVIDDYHGVVIETNSVEPDEPLACGLVLPPISIKCTDGIYGLTYHYERTSSGGLKLRTRPLVGLSDELVDVSPEQSEALQLADLIGEDTRLRASIIILTEALLKAQSLIS